MSVIMMPDKVEKIIFRDVDGRKIGVIKRGKDDKPVVIGRPIYSGPGTVEIKYRR